RVDTRGILPLRRSVTTGRSTIRTEGSCSPTRIEVTMIEETTTSRFDPDHVSHVKEAILMRPAYRLSSTAALCSVFVSGTLFVSSTWANEGAAPSLGTKLDEFALQDFRGKSHTLSDSKEAKLVVVAFLGVECPLSKLYGPRLAELAREYE